MATHPVDHATSHIDNLHGESQSEITLDQFGNQRITDLQTLFIDRRFVDFRHTVSRVDFTAQPNRHTHFTPDETDAAVLQFNRPIGTRQLLDITGNLGTQTIGHQRKQFSGDLADRSFQMVEIETDVFGKIGIGTGHTDLRHTQTDSGPPLLSRRMRFVRRSFECRIFRKHQRQRIVERQRPVNRKRIRRFRRCCRTGCCRKRKPHRHSGEQNS